VADATLGTATARVSIDVTAVNDASVANAGTYQVTAGASLSQAVSKRSPALFRSIAAPVRPIVRTT